MAENKYFIDTSALFKRYIKENGTEQIDLIFNNASKLIISSFTVVELISNLKRLFDVDKLIDRNIYDAVRDVFFKDISEEILSIEPVDPKAIVRALELIEEKYMTPIDSLQLSIAISLYERFDNLIFVCSDRKLCSLARDKAIDVLETI